MKIFRAILLIALIGSQYIYAIDDPLDDHIPTKALPVSDVFPIIEKYLNDLGTMAINDETLKAIIRNTNNDSLVSIVSRTEKKKMKGLFVSTSLARNEEFMSIVSRPNIRSDYIITETIGCLVYFKDEDLKKSSSAHFSWGKVSFYAGELSKLVKDRSDVNNEFLLDLTRDAWILRQLAKGRVEDGQAKSKLFELVGRDLELKEISLQSGKDTFKATVHVMGDDGKAKKDGFYEVWYVNSLFEHKVEFCRCFEMKAPIHVRDLPAGEYVMWVKDKDGDAGEKAYVTVDENTTKTPIHLLDFVRKR